MSDIILFITVTPSPILLHSTPPQSSLRYGSRHHTTNETIGIIKWHPSFLTRIKIALRQRISIQITQSSKIDIVAECQTSIRLQAGGSAVLSGIVAEATAVVDGGSIEETEGSANSAGGRIWVGDCTGVGTARGGRRRCGRC